MNDQDRNQNEDLELGQMRKLLKCAVPPVADTEPHRDLWPQMLRRLDSTPTRVPWWDWALLGGAIAATFAFPGVLPALLFHL
jgi:anti-sigma factor RsiW